MLTIPHKPLVLRGCTPTPLASYLKAVGILRLVSSPANRVTGQAADPTARGWWKDEHFHLATALDDKDLVHFLLAEYAPSPIIAPWNGGSGFYPKDNKDGFGPLASYGKVAKRFRIFSETIQIAQQIIENNEATEGPSKYSAKEKETIWKPIKWKLIWAMRNQLPDFALDWMDSALVASGSEPFYSSLLGTGGNDGRLDFANNFMKHLVSEKHSEKGVFNAASGEPTGNAEPLLKSALFASPTESLGSSSIGQFFPGAESVNSWDYILMLEGAIAFAGSAARRLHSSSRKQSAASFPFAVHFVGAGWGGLNFSDEDGAGPNDRGARGEFWAPLWSKPVNFLELRGLTTEGRAIQGGSGVNTGFGFARAAGSLGVSRGVSEFQRYGFLERSGKAYHATPIGRHLVNQSPASKLLADFDAGGSDWLTSVKKFGRHDLTPASARRAIKHFEDALFELVGKSNLSGGVEKTLVALGSVCKWLASNQNGREAVQPPPLLSSAWIEQANDNSAEFRIAAALASLGSLRRGTSSGSSVAAVCNAKSATTSIRAHTDSGSASERLQTTLPMVVHFAPIDERTIFHRWRKWSSKDVQPTKVWGPGNLISNMIAVLERRLIEATIHDLKEKPLSGATYVDLSDVEAFLTGDFDDVRCGALLSGLIWVKPARLKSLREKPCVPFAYAALKPLFTSDTILDAAIGERVVGKAIRIPIPSGLVARLRAGGGNLNGHATNYETRNALARARRSGLVSCFDPVYADTRRAGYACGQIGAGYRPDRLAASLLIPIGSHELKYLLKCAYPTNISKETNNAV